MSEERSWWLFKDFPLFVEPHRVELHLSRYFGTGRRINKRSCYTTIIALFYCTTLARDCGTSLRFSHHRLHPSSERELKKWTWQEICMFSGAGVEKLVVFFIKLLRWWARVVIKNHINMNVFTSKAIRFDIRLFDRTDMIEVFVRMAMAGSQFT